MEPLDPNLLVRVDGTRDPDRSAVDLTGPSGSGQAVSFDFGKLYLPPTPEQEQALREDIRRQGIRNAILVTPDGKVIAGHTRKRIADELGIDCPTRVITGTLAEQVAACVLENPQREVAHDQRRAAATLLRELGWSNRWIAGRLGVSEKTVRNDLAASATADKSAVADCTENRREGHGLHVGKDGRRRPSSRPTVDQRRRRRTAGAELYNQGYTVEKIGAALNISASTAAADVRELGLNRGRRRLKDLGDDVPEPIDWHSEPSPTSLSPTPTLDPPPPGYRTSPVIADVLRSIECFNSSDDLNQFARDIHDAIEHGDKEWLLYVSGLLAKGYKIFFELSRIFNNKRYRGACLRGDRETRTRSRSPKLKAVK
jgi:ParB-like chromosome segregation protein Spo0J